MEKGHLIYIENIFCKHFSDCENFKEDLMQEGFLALEKCKKNYDKNKGDFLAYIKKPIYNAMLKFVKKETKNRKNVCSLTENVLNTENSPTYEEILRDERNEIKIIELQETINQVIENFSKNQQTIIKKYIIGETQTEISKSMEISKQFVNHTIKRFKEELKFLL